MSNYKDLSPAKKWMVKATVAILLAFCLYAGIKYGKLKMDDKEQFLIRQSKTQHILIDKIDDQNVWLMVFDGDTVGTVSTK